MPEMEPAAIRDFLIAEVRPAVLGVYSPNSCVATVKVAIGVLEHAGVKARAWPCALLVANQEAAHLMVDADELTPEEIQALRDRGAHAVEIAGTGTWSAEENRWDGHLVVLADFADGPFLIDLSIDQARRGAYQIDVAPTAVRIRQMPPEEPVVSKVESCWVRWTGIRSDVWRSVKDWKRGDLSEPLTAHLIHQYNALAAGVEACDSCGHARSDHEHDVAGNMVCMILPGEGPVGCKICRTTHKRLTSAVARRSLEVARG